MCMDLGPRLRTKYDPKRGIIDEFHFLLHRRSRRRRYGRSQSLDLIVSFLLFFRSCQS